MKNFKKILTLVLVIAFSTGIWTCEAIYVPTPPPTFTVTFNSQGGSVVLSIITNYNTTITKPANPTRDNYIFVNWLYNEEVFNFNTPITANITLIAQWIMATTDDLSFQIINNEAVVIGLRAGVSEIVIPTHFNGHPVTRVDDWAFAWANTLTRVTLNEGLQTIGRDAFLETNITEITIPSTVISIGDSAFWVTRLTSITLNEGLQTIGDWAFSETRITEINIPGSVISIGNNAFSRIWTLTSVILNEGLQTIGNEAFQDTSITSIVIPSTVTNIGLEAFPSGTTIIRN